MAKETVVKTGEVKKEKRRRPKKGVTVKAKKKSAVARAMFKRGSGKIKINKRPLAMVEPARVREFIAEPLQIAGEAAKEIDIDIAVHGGGFMSQAVAARAAVAKCLAEHNNKLRAAFLNYDRLLLVDDPRRVESKKPLGPKARRKKQKSKR